MIAVIILGAVGKESGSNRSYEPTTVARAAPVAERTPEENQKLWDSPTDDMIVGATILSVYHEYCRGLNGHTKRWLDEFINNGSNMGKMLFVGVEVNKLRERTGNSKWCASVRNRTTALQD